MKRKRKIKIVLVVAGVIVCALLLLSSSSRERRELEATRSALRQQGFKTELKDFDLSIPPEMSRRMSRLATTTRVQLTNHSVARPHIPFVVDSFRPGGGDTAIVTWRLSQLIDQSRRYDGPSDLWLELREYFNTNSASMQMACEAATTGPIRFEPIGSQHPDALLPYLADLKELTRDFGAWTMLALHDGEKEVAWTNLLASTCLATSYSPEPIEVSCLVRFAIVTVAYQTMWNALQSHDWSEAQLAELQRRWEAVEFWSNLPETSAHQRANTAAMCQLDRERPEELGIPLSEAIRSPRYVGSALAEHWRRFQYRAHGSFADEKDLLLYYRDREVELKRAVGCQSWIEMRLLPGVTNVVPFAPKSRSYSPALARINVRQVSLAFQRRGGGLLGTAAEAEVRRRLIVTAIALERYRLRHSSYPADLKLLAPEFLKSPPIDFMDGRPLRFRPADEGGFVLYSVGLDGVDDGGKMQLSDDPDLAPRMGGVSAFRGGLDMVWPRPTAQAEAERLAKSKKEAQESQVDEMEDGIANVRWSITARRQGEVESILANAPVLPSERKYHGRPLSQVLWNDVAGTNKLSLFEMLTLKQVITGAEPEMATFELPLKYDVVTNIGNLLLCVDPIPNEDSDEGCLAGQFECKRATNGNCLLEWSTIYDPPGKHALQAILAVNEASDTNAPSEGPLLPYVVSNLCEFSVSSAVFNPMTGPIFRARLPEPEATYAIDIKLPSGDVVKTIEGKTTNGLLKVHWNLIDSNGRTCTSDAYDSVFRITLTESGRSQTLRGP